MKIVNTMKRPNLPSLEEAKALKLNILGRYGQPDDEKELLRNFFFNTPDVWISPDSADELIWFAMYDGGTNDIRVIIYQNGQWQNIKFSQLLHGELYGIMYKISQYYEEKTY